MKVIKCFLLCARSVLKNKKNLSVIAVMAVLLYGFSIFGLLKPADEYSDAERRKLAAFPVFSMEAVLSGDFMEEFEEYTKDQFPLRDELRALKAVSSYYVLRQKENNRIYFADGHISKLEDTLNFSMLSHAAEVFEETYDNLLKGTDTKMYFSIVPDKNYYLAKSNGYPSMDYEALFAYMKEETDYMKYIDISALLTADDYYATDTHWRQENLQGVAGRIAEEMGIILDENYTERTLEYPFYGVYCGQSALPCRPDTIRYLESEMLMQCKVTGYDGIKTTEFSIYDMEKAAGKDPYEMFLSGNQALLTITNPNAETNRELVVFRDSFAGSLIPLFAEAYAKITLIDLRYIRGQLPEGYLTFQDQDVLLLYSTLLLNNSLALRALSSN